MKTPLDGVRIVDFTAYFAGTSAGPWLVDFGAEVFKVEPSQGSEERRIGTSMYLQNESRSHQVFNRGKKSIVVDVTTPEGKEVIYKMVAQSDVVIHNFRYGVMDNLKFDYETLSKINPRIIYVNMLPYGECGPFRDLMGYDAFAQGVTGMCIPLRRVEPPYYNVYTPTGLPQADMQEGLHAAYGIALGLWVRRKTGKGLKVDTSLLSAGMSLSAERLCRVKSDPNPPPYFEPVIKPMNRAYKAAGESLLTVAVLNDEDWQKLCRVMGLEHLANDPRYDSVEKREPQGEKLTQEQEELTRELEERFSGKPAGEWIKLLAEARIPCGPVYIRRGLTDSFRIILEDPQVAENDLTADVENWFVGQTQIMGTPLKLRTTPGWVRGPAPLLNEHCDEILAWLGYAPAQINDLKKKRIVTESGFVPYKETGRPYPVEGKPPTEAGR